MKNKMLFAIAALFTIFFSLNGNAEPRKECWVEVPASSVKVEGVDSGGYRYGPAGRSYWPELRELEISIDGKPAYYSIKNIKLVFGFIGNPAAKKLAEITNQARTVVAAAQRAQANVAINVLSGEIEPADGFLQRAHRTNEVCPVE